MANSDAPQPETCGSSEPWLPLFGIILNPLEIDRVHAFRSVESKTLVPRRAASQPLASVSSSLARTRFDAS
ncbi:MAG TPA: hypothetical protein VFY72_05080, partial [Beijerinckiaceae bacterium]|nr:hypothetical protein [Beijerinckiaceae bacterium]